MFSQDRIDLKDEVLELHTCTLPSFASAGDVRVLDMTTETTNVATRTPLDGPKVVSDLLSKIQ